MMEENNEKKKHGRRRHYRGRNKDKAEAQVKEAGAESRQRQERPDKTDKPDRQRRKERKPGAARRETADEMQPAQRTERARREPEEMIFDFTWADALGLYGTGYHVTIKDNKEHLYLSWSVDLSYGELKLGQRLQEFLDDMKDCGIAAWDGHKYTKPGIFDGDTWSVKVNSLSLKAETQGTNDYPENWKRFLSCLHDKWGVPVSRREQWE